MVQHWVFGVDFGLADVVKVLGHEAHVLLQLLLHWLVVPL